MEQIWEGTATSPKLQGITPAQAWAIIGDYYCIHKCFPSNIHACSRRTHRCDGRPGSFRHVVYTWPDWGGHPLQCHWLKDQLLEMDPEGMKYNYELMEDCMGLGKTILTLRVAPAGDDGCVIQWSYELKPAVGWTQADIVEFLLAGVEEMAKEVGDAVRAAKSQQTSMALRWGLN